MCFTNSYNITVSGGSSTKLSSVFRLKQLGNEVKRDFFICWITLPADLKNLYFEKMEGGFCPAPMQSCLFLGIIRKHQENNYFKTSPSFS